MRRGLCKLAPPPPAAYSTFSGAGGFGRGRGSAPSPVPGDPSSDPSDEDPFLSTSSRGRGLGRADGPQPSFPSFFAAFQGRGRGVPPSPGPSENPDATPKKPFFSRYDQVPPKPAGENPVPGKPDYSSFVTALGRGKPTPTPSAAKTGTEQADVNRPIRNREEAKKRALEVLSRGGQGRGEAGMGRGRGRGRGRGMQGRGRGDRIEDEEYDEMEDEDLEKYVGPEIDEEKLKEEIGEEELKILDEAFDIAALRALPHPVVEAFEIAEHTNNIIEFEPEYLVGFGNPDVEEKPPISLEEALETAKPFLMAYEGLNSQEEWEEAVNDVMKELPDIEEVVEMYCGPDVVTAKQQQEELQRVASTLPANAPTSVKKFTDRVVLSLQSNPGWGFDRKCQFMDKLAWEINQHYK
ncbi:Hydroxyproline-rich glycoprotein-like [Rhynchospora pubera]|uniref:Hydroxyproline-rich glycoprotein-like n=1 Tax=Rhynchospora pubera TaxID=906938 RepID=A0AAV8G0K4_9POAL|nr:Hydroxyproline-rich glycoprotein-like [Rhynchospora pubera]